MSTRRGERHLGRDGSKGSRGFRAVLILVYGIFALSATARSLVQCLRDFDSAPVAYSLSFVAALTYAVIFVLLWRVSTARRILAWAIGLELAGVVGVGALSILAPGLFPHDTVWSHFGAGYGYVPLVLPLVASVTVWRSAS